MFIWSSRLVKERQNYNCGFTQAKGTKKLLLPKRFPIITGKKGERDLNNYFI
jgi:hypothetical protein